MKGPRILIGIIAFGSLWGALEAALGGALTNLPGHGRIMANIGFLIMAAAVGLYKKPGMQLGIGLVAASFKLLDVAIFHVPPLAQMIVNPIIAIIMEALAFELAVGLVLRRRPKSVFAQAGAGAIGIYLSYIGTALSFVFLTHMGPHSLLAKPWSWVALNGGFAALLALGSTPLGAGFGRLLVRAERAVRPHPALYYAASAGFVLLCLATSVWGTLTLG